MPGVNQMLGASTKMKGDYDRTLRRIQRAFRKMPRGSMSRCAFDLRISPTTVSTVVGGKRRSLTTLTIIEAWIDAQFKVAAATRAELVFSTDAKGNAYEMKEIPDAAHRDRRT